MEASTSAETAPPKRGGDATSALEDPAADRPRARKPHHRAKHKGLPPADQPQERGEYVAGQFRQAAERAAAAEKRQTSPEYDPHHAEVREKTRYSMNQLDERQLAAIEADYRAGVMSVADMETTHRISRSTLYALAEKRAWPLRSEIQAQMARAVQAHVVTATVRELREQVHGPSGTDRPLPMPGAAVLLPRDDDSQPQSARTIEDIARQDVMAEEYGFAVGLVLAKHREMASKAVALCDTLLQVQADAIADIKQRAVDMARDPAGLAKLLEPLSKSIATMLANTQKAVDMQRQALALDVGAGKGMALGELSRIRAAHAGMPIADQPDAGGDTPSPGNASATAGAIPLPAGLAGYEAIVKEAERRGVRLA